MSAVLLTRPKEDSEALAALLNKAGIKTLIDPLLSIEYHSGAMADLKETPDIFVATSRHSLLQCTSELNKAIPLFVTGESSAEAARTLGFTNIIILENARVVLDHIIRHYHSSTRTVFLSGRDVTVDVAAALQAQGYSAQRIVTYTAHAASAFSAQTIDAMQSGLLQGVTFFSARTVAIYDALVHQHGMAANQKRLAAFCLSPEIADAARMLPFGEVRCAQKTHIQSLADDVISRFQSR